MTSISDFRQGKRGDDHPLGVLYPKAGEVVQLEEKTRDAAFIRFTYQGAILVNTNGTRKSEKELRDSLVACSRWCSHSLFVDTNIHIERLEGDDQDADGDDADSAEETHAAT